MAKETFLDLSTATLYGYEHEKSDKIIASMIDGILAGDSFPPVYVCRLTSTSNSNQPYVLLEDGHYRAVAHFIQGKPLKCIVYDLERLVNSENPTERATANRINRNFHRCIPISQIKIVDDDKFSGKNYKAKKSSDSNYR